MALMNRWLVLAGVLVLVILAALLFFFRPGNLLRTGLPSVDTALPLPPGSSSSAPDDGQAAVVSHCEGIKQAHIATCGESFPDKNYMCRTKEAEKLYQECLTNTKLGDIPSFNENQGSETRQTGNEETPLAPSTEPLIY